jgi:hypothetical protein
MGLRRIDDCRRIRYNKARQNNQEAQLEEKYIMTKNEGMAAGLLSDEFLQDADSLALALAKKLWPEEMASDKNHSQTQTKLAAFGKRGLCKDANQGSVLRQFKGGIPPYRKRNEIGSCEK